MALQITGTPSDPALLALPWSTPLAEWPADRLVALPRGISRHTVRFVRISGQVFAIKEVGARLARREYRLLRDLDRRVVPCVEAVAVVTGRTDAAGGPLDSALITRHLRFSLPYRAVFSGTLRPETLTRLVDALAVLLVRLHLAGLYWGDCSLSNTLFRRDAGAFAAYLVDAETGELHPTLSAGQRGHDIEVAHINIYGELLDLEAGGLLHGDIDAARVADRICARYEQLWAVLTEPETIGVVEWHRVEARLRKLNELGFDVSEMQLQHEPGVEQIVVRPKVVDAGHHQRRLLRLTGLDVEENQARRLLGDLDTFRAALRDTARDERGRAGEGGHGDGCHGDGADGTGSAGADGAGGAGRGGDGEEDPDEQVAAHRWLTELFQPTVRAVPPELGHKLEPAQIYHEVLDHRWYLSEAAGHDVGLARATRSYLETVLAFRPDEQAVLGDDPEA